MIDAFVAELGKKFAERWLTQLMLPGLVFIAAIWCAYALGHAHALDISQLVRTTRTRTSGLKLDAVATVVLAVAVVAGSAAAAQLVLVLAVLVEKAWLLRRRGRPITRMGRALFELDRRVRAEYFGLRAAPVWPRLWLLLSDAQRQPVDAARIGMNDAAIRAGWAIGYLAVGTFWWPALLAGAIQYGAAWFTAIRQVGAYTTLVEAIIDINQAELAKALGLELPHGVITETEAGQINARLAK